MDVQKLDRESVRTPKIDGSLNETGRLVVLAQNGDRTAFEELSSSFRPMIFGIISRKLQHHDDAEDVTQDVFLKAFLKISELRSPNAFPGWICIIARRMTINFLVRGKTFVSLNSTAAVDGRDWSATVTRDTEVNNPISLTLSDETAEQVRAGVEALSDLDKDALKSFYFDDMSLKEMAGDHTPIGTMKRRCHTARRRLKDVLEQSGYFDDES